MKITFFIVGQDAALDKNKESIRSIAEEGHEIGNHSFHHEPWLHIYSAQEIEADITKAEYYIKEITGKKPIGFRGPGFSLSEACLKTLKHRNYLYDASTLPTFIGPLGRIFYFMSAKLPQIEMQKRSSLFGNFLDGFKPNKPYQWKFEDQDIGEELFEIPVTVMPIFRIPIHVSYLHYIAGYSHFLAILYLKFALYLCRLTNTSPSLLLHPLDFLGVDEFPNLRFFPGMNQPGQQKINAVNEFLNVFKDHYQVVPLQQFVSGNLPFNNYKLITLTQVATLGEKVEKPLGLM